MQVTVEAFVIRDKRTNEIIDVTIIAVSIGNISVAIESKDFDWK